MVTNAEKINELQKQIDELKALLITQKREKLIEAKQTALTSKKSSGSWGVVDPMIRGIIPVRSRFFL